VKLLGAAIAAVLCAVAPGPAVAGDDANASAKVYTLDGTCSALTFNNNDRTKDCKGSIVNATYAGGKSSFMFTIGDQAIVSFYGKDSQAKGDVATLDIEQIGIVRIGGDTAPTHLPAKGKCTYTNPYAGASHIDCTAKIGSNMAFVASFVSDGKPPRSLDLSKKE